MVGDHFNQHASGLGQPDLSEGLLEEGSDGCEGEADVVVEDGVGLHFVLLGCLSAGVLEQNPRLKCIYDLLTTKHYLF